MSSSKLIATSIFMLIASSIPLRAEHVPAPLQHTFFCLTYPTECKSSIDVAAQPLSKAQRVRELQRVNAAINRTISSIQLQPSPLKRFPCTGDCGDHAVTKRHVLLSRGGPSSDLLLTEVVLRRRGVHPVVRIAKSENDALALDDFRSDVSPFKEIFRDYNLIRIEAADNPEFSTRPSGSGLSSSASGRSTCAYPFGKDAVVAQAYPPSGTEVTVAR
ncbi:transglutaminase-like cysteine peptidase [Bradyrhizobium sp.]|uniref:transglutaminase-like cysteine peptidase n=1 Tax=Bradyrhizobium sp. TaxID=376 RepID=UPI0039E4E948